MYEMSAETIVPINPGITLYGVLFGSQRAHLVFAVAAETRYVIFRSTIDGDIEHFIGVHQIITEVLTCEKVRCDLVLWRNGQIQHRVLEAVLVVSLAVLIDGSRVTYLPVVTIIVSQCLAQVRFLFNVIVNVREASVPCLIMAITVSAHKRALHVSQERRRRRCALIIARRSTVIE